MQIILRKLVLLYACRAILLLVYFNRKGVLFFLLKNELPELLFFIREICLIAGLFPSSKFPSKYFIIIFVFSLKSSLFFKYIIACFLFPVFPFYSTNAAFRKHNCLINFIDYSFKNAHILFRVKDDFLNLVFGDEFPQH